ncbi:MAG: thiamine-phosphate kinase [Gammaproteobacteria bacterium]
MTDSTNAEFSLIDHYFKHRARCRDDVVLGIGDDAAVTTIPDGYQLVSAVDTLVENVHFPGDTNPFDIGYKSLAVNLSDMAAMGAEPAWATLALTVPAVNENWLKQFCDGFFTLAEQYNVQLIGGDTTRGPLTVSVQVMGLVPKGQALTRSGAKPGDRIFVSGQLGDAALALQLLQPRMSQYREINLPVDQQQLIMNRLNRPVPRVGLGIALRNVATAVIDISDGLAADLDHLLTAANVGATIDLEQIPVSKTLKQLQTTVDTQNLIIAGGDDYELCFTVPAEKCQALEAIQQHLSVDVTVIGQIEQTPGSRFRKNGALLTVQRRGYEHFSES